MAPHHGSNSSSTWPFLLMVKPRFAVFQAGYLNPYHHPHYKVIDRYELMNTQAFRTDRDGAVLFSINDEDIQVEKWRNERYIRYWQSQ